MASGGTLYLYRRDGTLAMDDTQFSDNSATNGYDMYLDSYQQDVRFFNTYSASADGSCSSSHKRIYPETLVSTYHCGARAPEAHNMFYVRPMPGTDERCYRPDSTACGTIAAAVAQIQLHGEPNNTIWLLQGVYNESEPSLFDGATTTVSPLFGPVTYRLGPADQTYFNVAKGHLVLSTLALAFTAGTEFTSSPIAVDQGSLTLTSVSVSSYAGRTALISFRGFNLTINGSSSFTDIVNSAGNGGVASGTMNPRGSLVIEGARFTCCQATQNGGAIYATGISTSTIKNSSFTNCAAGHKGAGLYLDRRDGILFVESTLFTGNALSDSADADGVDIYLASAMSTADLAADAFVYIYNSYSYPCSDKSISPNTLLSQLCPTAYTDDKDFFVQARANSEGSDKTCTDPTDTNCASL